jgi:cytochrome c553
LIFTYSHVYIQNKTVVSENNNGTHEKERSLRKRTAIFLASLALAMTARSATLPAGDAALGEYLSGQCTTCHQLSGKANGIPSIVGWDTESFIAVMDSYQKKERENKVMQSIAGSLSQEDIAALAAYFATIKPKDE